MNNLQKKRIKAIRLPKLAALMLFFLGLSTNTHLDAAPVWVPQTASAHTHAALQSRNSLAFANDNQLIHVLSQRDAELYREAFAAQEKADWGAANTALGQIKDKKLIGHVLADRYLHRDISLAEAQQWLTSYSDLPEAQAIYTQSRHLHGFASIGIREPQATLWSGNNVFSMASGFHSSSDGEQALRKNHVGSKINSALRHGDPMKARELLTTELQRGTLSPEDAADVVARIAAAFFYEGQIERARTMAHTAAASDVPLGLWIDGLSAWKQEDFPSAARSFTKLAQNDDLSPWDHAAAAYWAYRTVKHQGDEPQARHWLAEAAKSPHSFYGYLASNQIGARAERSWKMPDLNAKNIAVLSQRPAGWRALALVQVGKSDLAESELRHMSQVGQRDLQTATLALAEHAHMPSLTLQMGGLATNDNGQPYEAAFYPLPPWQPTDGFKVDRALIYALMKHESQFDPEAVSARGACGLMQIMPSTARAIANDNQEESDCPDRLFDPATNMELGQKYVRVLAGQPMIGDNLLLLLAAYNGGPGNLARWLDNEDRNDPLLFMETLPLHETHDYVQQVLLHYWMYRARLAEPETSVAELARGEWPHYALRDNGIRHAANQNLELASIDPNRFNAAR